jgi:uncharacterized protein (DUF302 family)
VGNLDYYLAKEVSQPFDRVVVEVMARLKSEGFNILTDIDIQETLNTEHGAKTPGYRILGACHPLLAREALGIEDKLGVLLPCNVIVHETAEYRVEVASVDPVAALDRSGNPALARIAFEIRRRLSNVVEGVGS